jgi:hypothetical protein
MPFGEIHSWAVSAAENLAGPWSGSSLEELPWCYRLASERRSIAVAISERFGQRLHESADHEGQQWWECPQAEGYVAKPLFGDFSHVYGNGEFPWEGLWTVTDPPPEVHDSLISAWDYLSGTTSRWRLPVRTDARVWNINGPADWVRLVETSPKVATAPHSGWELPGPNQHHRDIEELLSTPNQCAVRVDIERHVLPDWDAVARDYDGVHLSWGGFLTTEGYVSDLPGGGVTMLRYWGSERTLWLRDVFGEPTPLDAPNLSGTYCGIVGVDASRDEGRRELDLDTLTTLLGR